MTLGEQIRTARVAKRMTLRALARTIGVSAPFMSDVEHDRRTLTQERRGQIALALGIEVVLLDAAMGYTRELADWIKNNPELLRLLHESRATSQPLRIGCSCDGCRPLGVCS